jgi:hypothetical protein
MERWITRHEGHDLGVRGRHRPSGERNPPRKSPRLHIGFPLSSSIALLHSRAGKGGAGTGPSLSVVVLVINDLKGCHKALYDRTAEVTITHSPSTSDACEMHAQPVEKSIANLAFRLR